MTWRAALLGLLLLCVAADATKTHSEVQRKPSCPDMEITACPMNFAPVCGSDGTTYANECALCVQRQTTKSNILVVKEVGC